MVNGFQSVNWLANVFKNHEFRVPQIWKQETGAVISGSFLQAVCYILSKIRLIEGGQIQPSWRLTGLPMAMHIFVCNPDSSSQACCIATEKVLSASLQKLLYPIIASIENKFHYLREDQLTIYTKHRIYSCVVDWVLVMPSLYLKYRWT
jgi:hypothetical protein